MIEIHLKVAFNIASEASYVYILSGQKLFKNTQNGQFGEFLKNGVTRQGNFNRTKKFQNSNETF